MVSGPSGAGKTSVVEGLARRFPFHFSVSMTTRPPRPGEVDGEDYTFVDRRRFEEAAASGELVEWATYSGHLYGTPRAEVDRHLAEGHSPEGALDGLSAALPHFVGCPTRFRRCGNRGGAGISAELGLQREESAAPSLAVGHLDTGSPAGIEDSNQVIRRRTQGGNEILERDERSWQIRASSQDAGTVTTIRSRTGGGE